MSDVRTSPSGPVVDVVSGTIPGQRVLGNPGPEIATPVPLTTSEILDFLGGDEGDILVRGLTEWVPVPPEDVVFPTLLNAVNAVRFWLVADGATKAIQDSYNIASTSDGGAGVINVVFDTSLSVPYTTLASIGSASTTLVQTVTINTPIATGFQGLSVIEAGSGSNPVSWSFAGFGSFQ